MNFASCDQLLISCHSWLEFTRQLNSLPNTTDQGDVFERLVQIYMLTDPEYVTQFEQVWHATSSKGELPSNVRLHLNLPLDDEGIDLIALSRNGEYTSIQAKYRTDPEASISWGVLTTFISLTVDTCKNIPWGIVFTTSAKAISKQKLASDRFRFEYLDRFLALDDDGGIGWDRIHKWINSRELIAPEPKIRRDYQQNAVAAALDHFRNQAGSRGRIILPCGSGKSLIGYWIGRDLSANRILIAVPSLALVNQTFKVWSNEAMADGLQPNFIAVCSDQDVGADDQDSFSSNICDVHIAGRKDVDGIVDLLTRNNDDLTVVITTYQSGRVISEAARKADVSFDLAIMDEAHRTVGNPDRLFAHLLFDENIRIDHRVFMTATERQFKNRKSPDIVSMDDDSAVYGPRVNVLTFKEALDLDPSPICGYQIATLNVKNDEIRSLWESNRYLRVLHGDDLEGATRSIASGIALNKAYEEKGISRAISFHRSIRQARNFKEQQSLLQQIPGAGQSIDVYHVSSKTPTPERKNILRDFGNSARSLVTNARCLTEGVDIPAVDCILFAEPKRSVIDIVQATGRAMRPSPGKERGIILIPIVIPDGGDLDAVGEAFEDVLDVVKRLATQDERIVEWVKLAAAGGTPGGGIIDFDPTELDTLDIDLAQLTDSINLRLWQYVGGLQWRNFTEAREYVRGLGLQRQWEWDKWAKSDERPPDIPKAPWAAYQEEWINIGDWLGTGRLSNREQSKNYFDFYRAREYVRTIGLKTEADWDKWSHSEQCPPEIPMTPSSVYPNEWSGIGDWLGTGRLSPLEISKNYRDFTDARDYVHTLNLKTQGDWKTWTQSDKRPADIPSAPWTAYRGKGWVGLGDWLGTGRLSNRDRSKNFRGFYPAREYVWTLKLENTDAWLRFVASGALPDDIPSSPEAVYPDEWEGINDWLGNGRRSWRHHQWRPFQPARAWARSLGLKAGKEWIALSKAKGLPEDIPQDPKEVYKDEWRGMPDWLGAGKQRWTDKLLRPFEKAQQFVRGLGLTGKREWNAYAATASLPSDIPKYPDDIYGEQWTSWPDWLGTEKWSYFQAREYVRPLGITSSKRWDRFASEGNLPANIPKNPKEFYQKRGVWVDWADFLGYDLEKGGLPRFKYFLEARTWAHSIGLKNVRQWESFKNSEEFPSDIPKAPDQAYKYHGWISWPDWLGTERWTYQEARAYVRPLGIASAKLWDRYAGTGNLPIKIPLRPREFYQKRGEWVDWADFLGYDL